MHAVPRGTFLAAALAAIGLLGCAGASRRPVAHVDAPRAVASDAASASPATADAAPAPQAAPVAEEGEAAEDDGTEADDYQAPPMEPSAAATRPHAPVLELSDGEIASRVSTNLASLGAMSIGLTYSGALVNGVPLPESPYWERVSPGAAWCTEETRDYLLAAAAALHAQFPDSPKLFVGNISTQHGGAFPPHVSHQSGRDVDISYVLASGHAWYATATATNLDVARTWAFVRALVTETDIEMIFIDRRIQLLLRTHALAIGEDRAWIDSLFQYGGGAARPIIVHVRGHATHLHARFRSPIAEELGRRAYSALMRRGIVRPPTFFAKHVAKKGETLSHLALHFNTTIDVIKKANGLKTDAVREGKEYRIPQKGGVASVGPVLIFPRRLPPQSEPARRTAAGSAASMTPAVNATLSQ